MDNIELGLQLMVVGMSAVFLILIIVIWGGKLLIKAVNKIAPEEESLKRASAAPAVVDNTTMAVLQQVVAQVTGGKGRVVSAKKV